MHREDVTSFEETGRSDVIFKTDDASCMRSAAGQSRLIGKPLLVYIGVIGNNMHRKILIIFSLVLVFASQIWATPVLQLGAGGSFGLPFTNEDGGVEVSFRAKENVSFALEARLNLLDWTSFTLPVDLGGPGNWHIAAYPSANLNIPVNDHLDIAVGAGAGFMAYDDKIAFNGEGIKDGLLASVPFYRLAVTANIYRLSLSLAAELPTEGTLDDIDFTPDGEGFRLRASVFWNFS